MAENFSFEFQHEIRVYCKHPCHYNTHSDPMILALCPKQCACDNEKLVTECLGQPMGIVPFTLNPHLTVLKAVDVQLKGF